MTLHSATILSMGLLAVALVGVWLLWPHTTPRSAMTTEPPGGRHARHSDTEGGRLASAIVRRIEAEWTAMLPALSATANGRGE